MNPNELLMQAQYLDKYARSLPNGERETWPQSIDRVMSFLKELSRNRLEPRDYDFLERMMLEKKAMPSMRLLAMAGEAARRSNVTIFNCSYTPVNSLVVFKEAVLILMSGCGLGYSVERKYTDRLPAVKRQKGKSEMYVVPDTTEGWAEAVYRGVTAWFDGRDIEFDLSQIRPEGTPLKVKGGIASGPQHLHKALDKIKAVILSRQGGVLRPLDCHDIMCHIADAVVSGGVRRSAALALFDANDSDMLTCKSGDNLTGNEQRWNANNSMVITGYKSRAFWSDYVRLMNDSQRGEPGIFSRYAIANTLPERRDRSTIDHMGTNPCAEILINSQQFCNLSSAVCRSGDTIDQLAEKVIAATIVGTIQSMATHYPELRPQWAESGDNERLLGVDLMGFMDCEVVRDPVVLRELRDLAIRTNQEYADKLEINHSAAITCVKPSGNSSVLLDASPGIHARWSEYYIRRVTMVDKNPIRLALERHGVPMERKIGTENQWVVSFPIASPEGAIVQGELSALQQLNLWKMVKTEWCEHNPSCTITYNPNELDTISNWLFENQAIVGGLSFLPRFDMQYEQMPYEAIQRDEYLRLLAEFPKDVTLEHISGVVNVAATPACDGDVCELPLPKN